MRVWNFIENIVTIAISSSKIMLEDMELIEAK